MSVDITRTDDRPAALEIDRFDQWTNPADDVVYGVWCMLTHIDSAA